MLTAAQVAVLADLSEQLVDPIIAYLLEDISSRVAEAGQLTPTASYQIWKTQNLGMSQRKIKAEISKRLKVSIEEVEALMTKAAEVGYNFDISNLPTTQAIPLAANPVMQQVLAATVKQAAEDLTNITQTIGFVGSDGVCRELTAAYNQACDFAFQKVTTGAQDYISAIRNATKNLADKGIRYIDYASGVHTSMEAAVRRNILGGLGLMQEQISQNNHDLLGCDGWEISAHSGSAPDHEPIQGKQYTDEEYTRLNNSLVRRIGTLNCGHAAFPIILGINSPQFTAEELEKFRKDNEDGITVDGRHYTLYEATQRQRKIERAIRKQKNKILIDDALGDVDKLQNDQIRYQILMQDYKRFSKAAGLRLQHDRLEMSGFGPKQAKNAILTVDKKFKEILEKASNGDKIELDNDMESIIADKPFEQLQPLKEKLSDRAVRKWYNTQDAAIPSQIDQSLSIEDQARQACELRNQNRTNARDLMRNQKKRRELDITDPNKSFEELIEDKMKRKNLTREQAIADILKTATKTRKSVNKQLGLE